MNNHATVQSSAPVSAAPLLQVSGALIAIIALILAAAWLVKRLGFVPKRTGVNGLKISASASLGARERVVVVDVEDARLVLGVTAGQINLLHKLPPSAPTEEIPQPDFQSVMKNLLKRSPGGGQSWSLPVQTLVFITSLTFIPAILLMMTSFTRIIIVFGLLRNALGTPSAPPNQVLLGLALFLTFFIMSPVIDKIYVDAYQPFSEEKISMQEALEKGAQPLREFMLRQTREADLGLFARLANTGPLQGPEAVPMRILLPAYVTSELKTAFQIGFTIFIPFLIIDLVIASVLMALGMMMVPPATIALPFKLMLFVLVDGWQLLVGSLAQSFYS
ncbi:flagellar biosynthetic protein flip [Escherichia coli]|nr:flagellar biosynthetic protein flip [Escherichia coli]